MRKPPELMKKCSLLLLLFFVPISLLIAQDFSNKGKDFWLAYGYHVRYVTGVPQNQQEMILYFTSDQNATVTVEIPSIGYAIQYSVIANQVTPSAPIPKVGAQDARLTSVGLSNKGIHVTSDKPIVAYAHIYNASVSGASLLFPTNTLGKEYYSVNYTQRSNEGASNSFFFVVATEDDTQIEITPSASNLNGLAVGIPSAPISLKKGEVYHVLGTLSGATGSDLTGSKIRSISASGAPCKPIAVFSGSGKISIGGSGNGSADNLFAQAFPSKAWGLKYLTVPTGSQPNNFYRVCVKDPTTNVKLNGVDLPKSSLQNGFYYEFKNAGGVTSPKPNVIEADQPILVSQYMTTQGVEGNPNYSVALNSPGGDPEMIYLSPVEQTINNINLYSAAQFRILSSYINVVIRKEGVTSFKIDGVTPVLGSFNPHPEDPNYSYATLQVSNGSHSISSDSGFNA
ncbi:MAG: IgGFc-binding protein, partial [Sediminibacterium sp.]|nr:IgGFc-binding protein [Sediminibacterium sp.]